MPPNQFVRIPLGSGGRWVLPLLLLLHPVQGSEDYDSSSASLHVLAFEAEATDYLPDGASHHIVELDSAELPQEVSRLIVQPRIDTGPVSLYQFGLPSKILYLDAYATDPVQRLSQEQKRISRDNRLNRLSYRLERLRRDESRYSVILSRTRYQQFRFEKVDVDAAADRTTILAIRLEDERILFFAFTWTDAFPIAARSGDPPSAEETNIEPGRLISKILPDYPEEARFARLESVFRAAFIVTREGRVDPTRFVLLECLHPIFAREAMGAIIEGWEFEPVRIDGSPKEMYSTAGVRFILRR